MGALTLEEVDALVTVDPARSPVVWRDHAEPGVEDIRRRLDTLVARGCVNRSEWRNEKGPVVSYSINDLGRLALRVSLPGGPSC